MRRSDIIAVAVSDLSLTAESRSLAWTFDRERQPVLMANAKSNTGKDICIEEII